MSTETTDAAGVKTIVDTAIATVDPTFVQPEDVGLLVHALPPGGKVEITSIDKLLEPYRERPRRKVANRVAHTPDAFAAYVNRHALTDGTEVWADAVSRSIVGIIDSHAKPDDTPGWQDHRVSYAVQTTEAWRAWLANDGKWLNQQQFAEHIEDRAIDVRSPAAADMLELAQTFKATMGVAFKSAKILSTGQTEVEYREDIDATGGKAGNMSIPTVFELGLTPFEGAKAYKVVARFRYRITGGTLAMSYRLERPEDVVREAFDDVIDKVDELLEPNVQLYAGSPT